MHCTRAQANPTVFPGMDHDGMAMVNGNNALGHVVSKFSMQLAIDKAKTCGVGLVIASRSNHFGIAGEMHDYAYSTVYKARVCMWV